MPGSFYVLSQAIPRAWKIGSVLYPKVTLGQLLSSPGVGGGGRAHSCFYRVPIEQKNETFRKFPFSTENLI